MLTAGCGTEEFKNAFPAGREPVIEPDYSGVTIPYNIAPLNFIIKENAAHYYIRISSKDSRTLSIKSSDGKVRFPERAWKKLLEKARGGKLKIDIISMGNSGEVKRFNSVYFTVAGESVDPYLVYRLLYPGYESWVEMKIIARATGSFRETSLVENQLLDYSCINCHSFLQNNPDKFLLHVRGTKGGTYFADGRKLVRRTLRTPEMKANAVYPSWHPSGRYVAFSSNKTVQSFHMRPEKNIEVSDQFSSLIIYDTASNEISQVQGNDTVKYMETFPCWSPDGESLYYCRTRQVNKGYDYSQVRYDLIRKSFDPTSGKFGDPEVIFDAQAINKSVSFPAVSPDGRYLVFTLHDYGTFSIWHREADLYIIDLQSKRIERMNLNSDETESYHSWSSNSRWLVFSSKRGDGLTARPYFAYIGPSGEAARPFVLPQKDPTLYERLAKTFNRPELITGKLSFGARDFEKASGEDPVKAKWINK